MRSLLRVVSRPNFLQSFQFAQSANLGALVKPPSMTNLPDTEDIGLSGPFKLGKDTDKELISEFIVDTAKEMRGTTISRFWQQSSKYKIALDPPVVKVIVDELKIRDSQKPLGPFAVANCLQALQVYEVSSDPQLLEWINYLTDLMKASTWVMDGTLVGRALRGIRKMNSEREEVKSLLSALTAKVNNCVAPLNEKEVAELKSKLANLKTSQPEVQALFKALDARAASA
jgi:hypothetical protein